MNKQLQAWQLILDSLRQDIPVVLLYVVESIGSSPGRQGFFMAVNATGIMKGSIGGGIMEHKFVEMAKDLLKHNSGMHDKTGIRRQVHDKSAAKDQSGMICSGEQSIFIYPVQKNDMPAVRELVDTLHKEHKGQLVLTPGGISFSGELPPQRYSFQKQNDEDWVYRECVGFREVIHIIGGGHCGLALSRLMRMLDFYVHVYDERPGLNTMLQNEDAHEKTTLDSYADLSAPVFMNDAGYAVIMTFGYRTDDIALRAVIDKPLKYLGLLGSRKKIEKMWGEYCVEGWGEEKIGRIHAPIGVDIHSETPEEIAVSIAAEIIKVKNHADKDR